MPIKKRTVKILTDEDKFKDHTPKDIKPGDDPVKLLIETDSDDFLTVYEIGIKLTPKEVIEPFKGGRILQNLAQGLPFSEVAMSVALPAGIEDLWRNNAHQKGGSYKTWWEMCLISRSKAVERLNRGLQSGCSNWQGFAFALKALNPDTYLLRSDMLKKLNENPFEDISEDVIKQIASVYINGKKQIERPKPVKVNLSLFEESKDE